MTGPLSARNHSDQVGGRAKVTYDFALHGGAIGDILLDLTLPKGAVIMNGIVDVVTPLASGGSATVAIAMGSQSIKGATAIASYTGRTALTVDGTGPNSVKLTADRQLKLTIATAALTAGKLNIFVTYDISE